MGASMGKRGDREARPTGPWTAEEIAREQAAHAARIARARALGPEANIKQAAALARFANRVAAAAEQARRMSRREALDPAALLRFLHERGVEHIIIDGVA